MATVATVLAAGLAPAAGVAADTTRPAVTIAPPTTTTGATMFTFSEDVRGVSTVNTILRVAGGDTNLRTRLACKDAAGAAVRCDGSVRKALLTPTVPLVPGQRYTATANPVGASGPIKDPAGNALATTSRAFRADLSIGDGDPAVAYAWAPIGASPAYGGSYRQESTTGAAMTLTFSGDGGALFVVRGPRFGIAKLIIDGRPASDIDLYTPELQYSQPLPLYLRPGVHTVRIEVSGRKNGASSGYAVNLDAFQNGSAAVQNDPVVRSEWKAVTAAGAQGGSYVTSSQGGSRATMRFRGTSVQWRTLTGPDQGQARVFIDGVQRGTLIDNHATTAAYVSRTFGGLSDGVHTIRVIPTGTQAAAAAGAGVAVDSFLVG